MDHLPRSQLDDEKGKKRTEEEIGHLQESTGATPDTPAA